MQYSTLYNRLRSVRRPCPCVAFISALCFALPLFLSFLRLCLSSLDGFWDSENASEQRGYAAYLAAGEVASAFIDSRFSAAQQSEIKNDLYLIASTTRGEEIMGNAYFSSNYIAVADTEFSKDYPYIFDQPEITFIVGQANIGVNPAVLPYYQVQNTDGLDTPSILQVVAHELGHGLTGTADSGPGSNDNVYANEDPIMSELGKPTRLSCGGVYVLPNPYGF